MIACDFCFTSPLEGSHVRHRVTIIVQSYQGETLDAVGVTYRLDLCDGHAMRLFQADKNPGKSLVILADKGAGVSHE